MDARRYNSRHTRLDEAEEHLKKARMALRKKGGVDKVAAMTNLAAAQDIINPIERRLHETLHNRFGDSAQT